MTREIVFSNVRNKAIINMAAFMVYYFIIVSILQGRPNTLFYITSSYKSAYQNYLYDMKLAK